MIEPCMVTSAKYCSGVIWPPGVNGSFAAGQTRWMRINNDRAMPTNTEKSARNQYWMPMTLWSMLKTYLRMKPVGGW